EVAPGPHAGGRPLADLSRPDDDHHCVPRGVVVDEARAAPHLLEGLADVRGEVAGQRGPVDPDGELVLIAVEVPSGPVVDAAQADGLPARAGVRRVEALLARGVRADRRR